MNVRHCTLLLILFLVAPCAFSQPATGMIPGEDWLPGWEHTYDVVSYQGDDLFFLINGGADLFLEYGFVDVAAVELQHPDDGKLYLEAYRMDSDTAAFGVFSLRKGGASVDPAEGIWRAMGQDYMHLWHGSYYVSVSGGNLKPERRVELFNALTDYIMERGAAKNILPSILAEQPEVDPGSCIYLMGSLGMNNIYSFGPGNMFSIHEALVWKQENLQHFLFHYPSLDQSQEVYQQVLNNMLSSSRFSDFQMQEKGFVVTDRHGRNLHGYKEGNAIRLSLGQ